MARLLEKSSTSQVKPLEEVLALKWDYHLGVAEVRGTGLAAVEEPAPPPPPPL